MRIRDFVGGAVLVFSLAVTGCGKGDSKPGSVIDETPITGSLVEALREMENSPAADKCDTDWKSRKEEMFKALDRRVEAGAKPVLHVGHGHGLSLPSLAAAHDDRADGVKVRIPFGPIYLTDETETPAPRPGWQQETMGWPELYDFFKEIQANSTHPRVNQAWAQLDGIVRAKLFDDRSRLQYMKNMTLDPWGESWLLEAIAAFEACEVDAACLQPAIKSETLAKVTRHPLHRKSMSSLSAAGTNRERRNEIRAMTEALKRDHEMVYGFRRNLTMKRANETTWVVQMHPGPFAGVREQFSAIIADFWTEKNELGEVVRQVLIDWNTNPAIDGLYRIYAGDTPGGRSYVSMSVGGGFSDYRMVLQPEAERRAVAHETGHVLGFRDEYYTIWNTETCSYTVYSSGESLMSDHTTGVVRAEHWQLLEKNHPLF